MQLVLLHAGHSVSWSAWHFEPSVLGSALVVLGLYVYGLSLENRAPDWRRLLCFTAGALSMFMALVSPLDVGAHRLLSLHMVQHIFLATIGPPLVLLGLPPEALRRLFSLPGLGRALAMLTSPVIAAPLFVVNMWLWHLPPVYELALDNLGVHIAMHISFIATGLAFWWPIIQPLRQASSIGEGGKLLYLFVSGFPMGLLALLLLSSANVVYSYYETAPRLWGVSPIHDQQVAGMIMGSLGELASFAAMTLLFFRFLDHEQQASDAARGPKPIDVV